MADNNKNSRYKKIFEKFKKNDHEILAIGKLLCSGNFDEVL